MKLDWSVRARADRAQIYSYIEADNPRAAVEIDARFDAAVRRLHDFPDSGRPGRVEGTRKLAVGGTPYIIPYNAARNGSPRAA